MPSNTSIVSKNASNLSNEENQAYELVDSTLNIDDVCFFCKKDDEDEPIYMCDFCDNGYHKTCYEYDIVSPTRRWCCRFCLKKHSEEKNKEGWEGPTFKCQNCCLEFCEKMHPKEFTPSRRDKKFCIKCQTTPISDKVEKILESRTIAEGEVQYFVKFENIAYYGCEWVGELSLEIDAPESLQAFKKHNNKEELKLNPEWLKIDRIVYTEEDDDSDQIYLVKWKKLDHSNLTWESPSTPGINAHVQNYKEILMSLPNKHIRTQKLDDIPRDIYATVEDVFDKRLENEFSNQSSYQCSDIYKVKPQCLDSFIEKFFTHQSKNKYAPSVFIMRNEMCINALQTFIEAKYPQIYLVAFTGSKLSHSNIVKYELALSNDQKHPKFDCIFLTMNYYKQYFDSFKVLRMIFFFDLRHISAKSIQQLAENLHITHQTQANEFEIPIPLQTSTQAKSPRQQYISTSTDYQERSTAASPTSQKQPNKPAQTAQEASKVLIQTSQKQARNSTPPSDTHQPKSDTCQPKKVAKTSVNLIGMYENIDRCITNYAPSSADDVIDKLGFRSEDKKEIIAEYMLKRILHLRSKKRMTKIYDYNFVDKLEIDKILAICPKISSNLIIKSLEDTNLRDFVENITQNMKNPTDDYYPLYEQTKNLEDSKRKKILEKLGIFIFKRLIIEYRIQVLLFYYPELKFKSVEEFKYAVLSFSAEKATKSKNFMSAFDYGSYSPNFV